MVPQYYNILGYYDKRFVAQLNTIHNTFWYNRLDMRIWTEVVLLKVAEATVAGIHRPLQLVV